MARQRKLSPERKEFLQKLLSAYQPEGAQDVQNMLKDLFGDTLQTLLEAEMDEHLGYSKYDYKNKDTDDSRNGYSRRIVKLSATPLKNRLHMVFCNQGTPHYLHKLNLPLPNR